jgi:hypothetical protein
MRNIFTLFVTASTLLAGCVVNQEVPRPVSPSGHVPEPARLSNADVATSLTPVANGVYRIRNVGDSEVITGPKAAAEQWVGVDDDRGRGAQHWRLLPLGGRKYQLQVGDALLCLADHGKGVLEQACDASDKDQHWLVVQHRGHYEILFRDSSRCLGVGGRGKLVDTDCHGTNEQLWDFLASTR